MLATLETLPSVRRILPLLGLRTIWSSSVETQVSSAEPLWFTKVTKIRDKCLPDLWPPQGRMTWVWAGRRTASPLATPEPGLAAASSLKLKNRTQYKNVSTSIFLFLTINIPELPRGNRRQPQYLG